MNSVNIPKMHLKLAFLWIPVFWVVFCCIALIVLDRIGFFRPRHLNLRFRGINLELAGYPDQAETCFREALKMAPMIPAEDRTRLMVCLGDSLVWQDRYGEAMTWFDKALTLGDPTGSCQQSICDLLLILKDDPERALIMAEQSRDLARHPSNHSPLGSNWNAFICILNEARYQARKANALQIAGRQSEARASIEESLQTITDHEQEIEGVRPNPPMVAKIVLGSRFFEQKSHQLAETHWRIGLALLALHDQKRAAEQFRFARDAKPTGLYRTVASRKLAEIEDSAS